MQKSSAMDKTPISIPLGMTFAHRAAGGDADSVAEDLLAEVRAEDAAGQPYSHKPGHA